MGEEERKKRWELLDPHVKTTTELKRDENTKELRLALARCTEELVFHGKKQNYLTCEGWLHLFDFVGLKLKTEKVEKIGDGFLATVSASYDGINPITQAVGACFESEQLGSRERWQDKFMIVSMSQTRAIGKLGWMLFGAFVETLNLAAAPLDEGISYERAEASTALATPRQINLIQKLAKQRNIDTSTLIVEGLTKLKASDIISGLQ